MSISISEKHRPGGQDQSTVKRRAKARHPRCSMPFMLAALLTLLLTLSPNRLGAHPGGRDSHGGHQVRQTGRYHFHAGPLKGQEFASKGKALEALNALERVSSPPASPPEAASPPAASQPSAEGARSVAAPPSGTTITLAAAQDGRGNTIIASFSKAKKAMSHVYAGHEQEFYCGCRYTGSVVDLASCGYEVKKSATRARRLEWEHVVPAENFGRSFVEWREGHPACVDK